MIHSSSPSSAKRRTTSPWPSCDANSKVASLSAPDSIRKQTISPWPSFAATNNGATPRCDRAGLWLLEPPLGSRQCKGWPLAAATNRGVIRSTDSHASTFASASSSSRAAATCPVSTTWCKGVQHTGRPHWDSAGILATLQVQIIPYPWTPIWSSGFVQHPVANIPRPAELSVERRQKPHDPESHGNHLPRRIFVWIWKCQPYPSRLAWRPWLVCLQTHLRQELLAHPPRLQTPPLLLHPGCFSAKKLHPYRNKPARPRQAMPASAIFWPYQEKQPQRTSWCFFYEHHLKLGENIWDQAFVDLQPFALWKTTTIFGSITLLRSIFRWAPENCLQETVRGQIEWNKTGAEIVQKLSENYSNLIHIYIHICMIVCVNRILSNLI